MNYSTKGLFEYIGKYRSALMGMAMILVFLFHARSKKLGFMPTGIWESIFDNFNLGVDAFFFLSAFGLCFSLKKNDIRTFYQNRFKRILPTWWTVLLCLHLAGILIGSKFPVGSFDYPHTATDMFFWYTGLGFFFNMCHYEWYIPTLMLFYLIIPAINKLSRNQVLLLVVVSVLVVLVYRASGYLPYLNIAVTRIPIFLFGVLFFKDLEGGNDNRFFITCIVLCLCVSVLSLFVKVPTVIRWAPVLPIIMGLFSWLISFRYSRLIEIFLSFVGTISLEFYLIHPLRRPQYLLSFLIKDKILLVVAAFVLCLILSYILHVLTQKVNEKYLFPTNK